MFVLFTKVQKLTFINYNERIAQAKNKDQFSLQVLRNPKKLIKMVKMNVFDKKGN